jgi:hypothetical protein
MEIVAMAEQLVKEFSALDEAGSSRIRVRVVRLSGQREARVDIRQFVQSSGFTGWTRRGVRLDTKAFRVLVRQAPRILKVLESSRGRKKVPLRASCSIHEAPLGS